MLADVWRHAEPLLDFTPLRRLSLSIINAVVAVHDPCRAKLASLGPTAPAENELPYTRLENLDGTGGITVADCDHPTTIVGGRPFRYQPYDEPRLHRLRAKYRLDEVVGDAHTELEALIRLRNWTRSQFRRSDYQPIAPDFDALEVLDRRRRNHANEPYRPGWHIDPCHFFPLLYCQVVLSMGHQARLVSIGHGMAEVWSNQFRKWVTMDAELNLHYEKDGVPLNMLEVFEENYADKPTRLRIVRGREWSGDPSTTLVYLRKDELPPEEMIACHHTHLDLIDLRNDWMTNRYFPGHPARSERNSMVYSDPRLAKPLRADQRLRPQTRRKEDLYWSMNQVEVLAHTSVSNPLQLYFKTVTPNFDYFELVLNNGDGVRYRDAKFAWSLRRGGNQLRVTPINRFGVKGVPSRFDLSFDCVPA